MKKIILITLFLFSISCLSENLKFYNLEGIQINTDNEPITVSTFESKYFSNYKFTTSFSVYKDFYNENSKTGILAIYFQEFTNKPLYILGNKPTKTQINAALKTYNYINYLKSSEFKYKLRKYVNENKLTIEDVYFTFGKPSKETITSDITFFEYNFPFLVFTIINGKVTDFVYIKPD